MSSLVRLLLIAGAVWAGSVASASAQLTQPGTSNVSTDEAELTSVDDDSNQVAVENSRGRRLGRLRRGERLAPAAVPELDPNAAGLALALLMGGALISIDRRRQRVA